jgi:GNAT superfamily N-acetyltransferase
LELPLDERDWNVGLVVGPSGVGKSSAAHELFGEEVTIGYSWPEHRSVVDGFEKGLSIKEITGWMTRVGFSSPPSWRQPFHTLSTGQQFRVTLARALAQSRNLVVFDEFSSVVDRQVARVASAAIAKGVRAAGRRFVAVTCHYDVENWLQPDWVYQPAEQLFQWRSVRQRPGVELELRGVDRRAWSLFAPHHYLSSELTSGARCYCGFVEGRPVVFAATMHFRHPQRPHWRIHRLVTLPDWQGIGVGMATLDGVAGLEADRTGKRVAIVTSHPGLVAALNKSPRWALYRSPTRSHRLRHGRGERHRSKIRKTAGFQYLGGGRATAQDPVNG